MIIKYILVLLCCYVYGVVSISSFFKEGQRPELYELLDNEMPTVKIFMPENEFVEFKTILSINDTLIEPDFNIIDSISNIMQTVKFDLKYYKQINFTEAYSGYNFDEILPQLQVGKDGYPEYDVEEIFKGFNYDPEYYIGLNIEDIFTLMNMIFESNVNFNLNEIFDKLNGLKKSISDKELYKMVGDISFEPWEYEEFDKYKDKSLTEEFTNNDDVSENKIEITDFKTKNATMTFELNGIEKKFNKVTFSLSGQNARNYPKPMYSLKIKNGKKLYGRSHFRLRSDLSEPTYLRTKLVSDIRNRLGMVSVSSNYIQLYINDEYMGLYIITDSLNLSWIEDTFGDKKSSYLYKCVAMGDFLVENVEGCINKNEDVTDHSEWIDFLQKVENAKSASDIDDIFNIDHFLYEMAIDYLLGAQDHYLHNFFLYKHPNGKWTYLSYDFDYDFGFIMGFDYNHVLYNMTDEDYFNEFNYKGRLTDLLISQNHTKFNEIIKEIVQEVFNPYTLYQHIDEVKQFIKPYVTLDKTPDSNGNYPGAIMKKDYGYKYFTLEQWDAYSEFTKEDNNFGNGICVSMTYGLKYWVLMKYRDVCQRLNMECDPIYMNENYEFPVNKDLECNQANDNDNHDTVIIENPTEIPFETVTQTQTEISTTTTTSSTESYESETVYDVDVDIPTPSNDDESSYDEED